MNKTLRFVSIALVFLLAITACNLPSGATQEADTAATMVAQTVEAQLTLSAPPTATSTPLILPTVTTAAPPTLVIPPTRVILPTATSSCDISQFVTDVTIPDGTTVSAGQAFTKTWRLRNAGTCSWTPSYAIVFSSGNSLSGPATQALVGNVNPGQTVDISVNLTAPSVAGDYTGYWKIRAPTGVLFAQFYVQIKVLAVTSTPTVTATPTNTLPAPVVFAITNVTYSVSTWSSGGNVNCPRIIANITANAAGTITYTWTTSSGTNPPATLVFSSAGTQSINYDWVRGSVWSGTPAGVGIYVNAPNPHDFGQQTFTTACTTP